MDDRLTYDHYCVDRRPDGSLWELGRGGMGVTFKAQDVNLGCPVALKVINASCFEEPIQQERFVEEARAAALLRHRHIATVHHLGSDRTHFFYAMEFIEGETCEQWIERHGPMPLNLALRLTAQVASALGAASRAGLVHRDVKPGNIMMASDPDDEEGPVAKLIDFGLVHSAACEADANGFIGTPHFCSPEQAQELPVDLRSDLYSLGCTLWVFLTGKPPFTGTIASIFAQQLNGDPPWEKLPACPPEVRELLTHLLRKDPADRPQSAKDLRREIERCLLLVRRQEGFLPRLLQPISRLTHPKRPALALSGASLVAITLAIAVWPPAVHTEPKVADAMPAADSLFTPAPASEWPDLGSNEEPFWSPEYIRRILLAEGSGNAVLRDGTEGETFGFDSSLPGTDPEKWFSKQQLWANGLIAPPNAAGPFAGLEKEAPLPAVAEATELNDQDDVLSPAKSTDHPRKASQRVKVRQSGLGSSLSRLQRKLGGLLGRVF